LTNIQPVDHFKDSGTTGTKQATTTDARVTTLQQAAVRLSPRTLDGTSLLHVLNVVYSAVDSKRPALLVVLDISAAFDTISHSFVSRLESDYGVQSDVLKWIQSYVMDWKQFLKLGRHTSSTRPCTAGVPQGSVLGRLLFTAYVSPNGHVNESFSIGYHQFADDIQLFVAADRADSADLTCITDCSDAVRRGS